MVAPEIARAEPKCPFGPCLIHTGKVRCQNRDRSRKLCSLQGPARGCEFDQRNGLLAQQRALRLGCPGPTCICGPDLFFKFGPKSIRARDTGKGLARNGAGDARPRQRGARSLSADGRGGRRTGRISSWGGPPLKVRFAFAPFGVRGHSGPATQRKRERGRRSADKSCPPNSNGARPASSPRDRAVIRCVFPRAAAGTTSAHNVFYLFQSGPCWPPFPFPQDRSQCASTGAPALPVAINQEGTIRVFFGASLRAFAGRRRLRSMPILRPWVLGANMVANVGSFSFKKAAGDTCRPLLCTIAFPQHRDRHGSARAGG